MFARTFVINLDRRPDRWEQFQQRFPVDWPFVQPERFAAIDGEQCVVPEYFNGSIGAWGCYQTHLQLWQMQIRDELGCVLILEDDAVFSRDAVAVIQETLRLVPDDWEQIYFGGQYRNTNEMAPEVVVQDKLVRCRAVNRTHAYAIRLPFAQVCYEHMTNRQWPKHSRFHHVDYRLEELHDSHRVYAPWRFCVGQARGTSDVKRIGNRPAHAIEHWWNQYPIVELAGVR